MNAETRTVAALQGDKVESRFVVGTCGISETAKLHLLGFHSDLNQFRHEAILEHPAGPVKSIATSPSDKSMLLTATDSSSEALLLKIPVELLESSKSSEYHGEDDEDDFPPAETAALEQRAVIQSDAPIVDLKWRGGEQDDHASSLGDVLTLDSEGNLKQYDVAFGAAEPTRQCKIDAAKSTWNLPPRMSWDPHSSEINAISTGTDVCLLDWRDPSIVDSFWCHRYGITSLDLNPNKPHTLVTAGQEGLLKFWDLRSHKHPLLTVRGGHRHWATDVKFNPFHDQLLLSAGTDSAVNLWRISTISSAPLLTLDDNEEEDPATMPSSSSNNSNPNIRVARHEYMDSVFATAWGAADAWIYASASYDGKVVVNHVPSKEKYKILL